MNRFFKILSIVFLITLCGWKNTKKTHLVVGTSADYPPFSFTRDKQITGFDIDLAKEIANELGYELLVKNMSFSELIPALQQKKIDFAVAAMTITSQRLQYVDFSAVGYYQPQFALLYLKNNPITSVRVLESRVVAVQSSSTMEGFLKERLNVIENAKMVSFENTSLIIEDLKEGLVDAVLVELAEAKIFSAENENLGYSAINTPVDSSNYAIAFPKRSKLISKIDNAMVNFKISNKLDRLKYKWHKSNLAYNMLVDQ
ncbi:MAG: transporter substrate-binding domain-containing protein [Rickettsiales bacterium]|nr:transporter substrate-binding domain-containing protein [Rickettsiales bacterium]